MRDTTNYWLIFIYSKILYTIMTDDLVLNNKNGEFYKIFLNQKLLIILLYVVIKQIYWIGYTL